MVLRTVLVVLALTAAAQGAPPPSPVIFPEQRVPLRFFHDKHVAEGLECTDCHEQATRSVSAADLLVPTGREAEDGICTDCHDLDEGAKGDPPAACATCHPGTPQVPRKGAKVPRMVFPPPNLKMNHRIHVAKGIPCTRCHQGVERVGLATRDNALPRMETCLGCHDGRKAPSECRTCHLTRPDRRLRTRFATGVLAPSGRVLGAPHDEGWVRHHAQAAGRDPGLCDSCHTERECLKCHDGIRRPLRIHPNDWLRIHPVAARLDAPRCESCHRMQTFCFQCHQRMGVASPGEFAAGGAEAGFDRSRFGSFHPPGWVSDASGAIRAGIARPASHHSFQAQRNIHACASCHTERTCMQCHAPGTLSISPHGAGFAQSRRCQALRARSPSMCARCHTAGTPPCR